MEETKKWNVCVKEWWDTKRPRACQHLDVTVCVYIGVFLCVDFYMHLYVYVYVESI